jgi:DNA-binding MarR family transcriptional regulator
MNLMLSEFASRVQRLIYQLVRSCELCDRVCLTQHGVTASQGYTLLALPQERSVSMNELSETMGLASSTMTRMVDQLFSKGFVSRGPDHEDRRVVRVELTAQGQQVRRTLEKAQQDLLQAALDDIPEDERSTILHALERVTTSLTKAVKSCCAG